MSERPWQRDRGRETAAETVKTWRSDRRRGRETVAERPWQRDRGRETVAERPVAERPWQRDRGRETVAERPC